MNALTRAAPSMPALAPSNLREAMDLANVMCRAKLLPQALQNSPGDVLLVIEQASRWGMSPFAVAQEVSVIQGKLMYSGKIVAAAVQSSGVLRGRLQYDYSGEGDARQITVTGHLNGEQQPRSVTVNLKDVKTTNRMWTQQADQQLAYSGARVWARRYVPEVMLGVYAPEDFAPSADKFAGTTIDVEVASRSPEPTPVEQGQPRETERVLDGDGLPMDLAGHEPRPMPPDDAARLEKFIAACGRVPNDTEMRDFEKRFTTPFMQRIAQHGWREEGERLDAAIKAAWRRIDAASAQQPAQQGGDPFDLAQQKETV